MNRRTAIVSILAIGLMPFFYKGRFKTERISANYGLTIKAAISSGYPEVVKDIKTGNYKSSLFGQILVAGYYININDIESIEKL